MKEYVDDGYTGTNYDRPALKDVMEEIGKKDRSFDIIIVKDLSRFGRDYIGAGKYIQKIFLQLHIRFISINDNLTVLTFLQHITLCTAPVDTKLKLFSAAKRQHLTK